MKKSLLLASLTFLIVGSLVLASCTSSTTAPISTTTTSTTTTVISTPSSTSTTSTIVIPSSTTSGVVTSTAVTTTTGKWWDSLGTPEYGGTLIDMLNAPITAWEPYYGTTGLQGYCPYLQEMWCNDYTVDPNTWDFSIGWLPSQYAANLMLTAYSMPNPYTVVCNLRTDMYWQNIAPSNGRQLTSADIVAHYDRILGLGNGFTTVDPYYASTAGWYPLISVVATDKFTVTFNWKQGTSPVSILTIMQAAGADDTIEDPDAVAAYTGAGNPALGNWHNAIGSGPFMLTDYVDSSSATYVANPNYWGFDFRWPKNKLPYLSQYKLLIIPAAPTAEAAMRVGKIDAFSGMPVLDALNMTKTNPGIVVKQLPQGNELTLDPNNAVAPFNNLSVRIAIQHAINIPLIASTYYNGYATPWPASLTENQMGLGGWGLAYPNWPADVQAQYTFDPALSKQLLAAAKFDTSITYPLILETDADQGLYQIVQSELAAVGINLSITLLTAPTWQATVMTSHNYTAFCARNQGILGFNFDIFRQFMRFTPGYQANYIQVNDPNMTSFNTQAIAAQSIGDVQKLLTQANLYAAQNHFAISLAQPSTFNMVQPWVQGNPGGNTLGNAITGTFGGTAGGRDPIGLWISKEIKAKY